VVAELFAHGFEKEEIPWEGGGCGEVVVVGVKELNKWTLEVVESVDFPAINPDDGAVDVVEVVDFERLNVGAQFE